VQDTVAEGADFAFGQVGVVGEADQFGPGDQICCGQDDFQPCGVRLGPVTGEVTQPGGFGLTNSVLDPGVLAMPQFQAGELARHHTVAGVSDERGDAVPVGVGEPQLRAGVGPFLAQHQPGPGRPAAHVDQRGGFGDPGALAQAAAGIDGRIPAVADVPSWAKLVHTGAPDLGQRVAEFVG
jgi:hypothetical protein